MDDNVLFEMIREEPIFPPSYVSSVGNRPYKTKLLDRKGNIVGYALECEDSDLDIMLFWDYYHNPNLKGYIDSKVKDILSRVKCATKRILPIDRTGSIYKDVNGNIPYSSNFTNSKGSC